MIRLMSDYDSAVLSAVDESGYPFSFRCHPQPDQDVGGVRVEVPSELMLRPGPASLLWHKHDDQLWHQRSFIVRGTLDHADSSWFVIPNRLVLGVGNGGVRGVIRYVRTARRIAGRYLDARNIRRPSVPWDEIITVKKSALRGGRFRSR